VAGLSSGPAFPCFVATAHRPVVATVIFLDMTTRDGADLGEPSFWRRFSAALTFGDLLWTVGLALVGALIFGVFFFTSLEPLLHYLGHALIQAVVVLLAHTAAGQWRSARMPRWKKQAIALLVSAPLGTLLSYVVMDFSSLVDILNPGRLLAIRLMLGMTLLIGFMVGLASLYRERDEQANAQALTFALERQTLERQTADARLAVLQSQLAPHFLFNTLANVQALVESGSPRAAPVLASLIQYLRAAIPRIDDGAPTLGNEEALVRAYLELMQMRMPDRLQYSLAIDPQLRAQRLPAMLLLTLVENAVRHGIDQSEIGGHIEVGARLHAATGLMRLWVSDTGVGIDESRGSGTGLANLRARLAATYGDRAQLLLSAVSPHGVHAEVELPAQT
jgi:signal transduction histidine kinase